MNNRDVKVSIIIPVYNVEKNLRKCLDSVINQTLKEIEIILVDDGSTDGSAEICKSYLRDHRVVFISQKNQGAYGARQNGLDHANGEYIGFVDADDWIEPEMYQRMYEAALEENADIVVVGTYWDNDKLRPENFPHGVYNRARIESEILSGYIASIDETGANGAEEAWNLWSKIYRRQIIIDNGLHFVAEYRRTQEMAFNFKFLLVAEIMVSICNEHLYHWRVESNDLSACRGYTKNYWKMYKPMIEMISEDVENYHKQDLSQSLNLCIFFLASMVLRNEWVFSNLKKSDMILKLDELAKEPIIKNALSKIPKDKLNESYQSDYNALMCASGEEMLPVLKEHSYYKRFRRPIRIKRKLSKYKLFSAVYRKIRKKLIRIVRKA